LAFTKTNRNETWTIAIEKAWAKLHGSYERIVGGAQIPSNDMRDLTGAPAHTLPIKNLDDAVLWNLL